MRAPLPDRIAYLEAEQERIMEKMKRMRAQLKSNSALIDHLRDRLAKEQPPQKPAPAEPRPLTAQEQNDRLAAYFAAKKKKNGEPSDIGRGKPW